MRQTLIGYYLDYVNNYLTVDVFAEHNGLTPEQALTVIQLGKQLHETPHPAS